jgi:hypothetical protein
MSQSICYLGVFTAKFKAQKPLSLALSHKWERGQKKPFAYLFFLGVLLMAGCASMHTVHSDVSTYSQWPAGRAPSTYYFERLPSQQAQAAEQSGLEALAKPSIEAAGFKPAPDAASADVSIQLAVRTTRTDLVVRDDPFWWRGGYYAARPGPRFYPYPYYPHRYGYGYGHGFGVQFASSRFMREAVVLVRDRASNQTLYEAHAVSEGNSPGSDVLVGAMFKAALVDFPSAGINPRPVVVQLGVPKK